MVVRFDKRGLPEMEEDRLAGENVVEPEPDLGAGILTEEPGIIAGEVGAEVLGAAEVVDFPVSDEEFAVFEVALEEEFRDLKPYTKNVFLINAPERLMKELVYRAYRQNPSGAQALKYVTANGVVISTFYHRFCRAGLKGPFLKWFFEQKRRSLHNLDTVLKLVGSERFGDKNTGWDSVRDWWPELMRVSFERTPFVAISSLRLVDDEHVGTPYKYVGQCGDGAGLKVLQDTYDECFDEKMALGYESFVEYVKVSGRICWNKVPLEWQEEFVFRAFQKTPFVPVHKLEMEVGGKLVKAPDGHYRKQRATEVMQGMWQKAFETYVDSESRAIDFYEEVKFKFLGGWARVPAKIRQSIIWQAVLQNEGDDYREMIYTHSDGRTVFMEDVFRNSDKAGLTSEYEQVIRAALVEKKRLALEAENNEREEKLVGSSSKDFPWVMAPLGNVEMGQLIRCAKEAGDEEVAWEVARRYGRLMIKMAYKYTKSRAVVKAMVSDALLHIYETVKKPGFYDESKNNYYSYFLVVLTSFYPSSLAQHGQGMSKNKALQVQNGHGEYSRALKAAGISFGKITDVPTDVLMKASGKSFRAVELFKQRSRVALNLDAEIKAGDSDGTTLGDFVEQGSFRGPEEEFLLAEKAKVLSGVVSELKGDTQLIVRRQMGLRREGGGTFEELMFNLKRYVSEDIVNGAVERFVYMLRYFVENPWFVIAERVLSELRGVLDSSLDIKGVIDKENALGYWLRMVDDEVISNVLAGCMDYKVFIMGNEGVDGEFVFEDIEKIVLLELFDIPHSGFIPFHIAKAFGCSRQNINQKVNAAKIVVEDRLFHAVDDDEDEIDALTDEYFDPDKGVTAENYAALNSNLKRW